MKILTVLAATAVAAAITIPAVADERPVAEAPFVSCLRSQGLDIPAETRGAAIKQWSLQHADDPATERAFGACKPKGEAPERLIECLRGEGLEAPTAIDELKPWLGRKLEEDATSEALSECGVTAPAKGKPGDRDKLECGAVKRSEDEAAQ